MIEIPAGLEGMRVDRAVATLTGLARAEVARLLDRGGVRLEGVAVSSAHRRVVAGQKIEIDLSAPAGGAPRAGVEPEDVEVSVVYEDAALVVVDKPAGLVVHPGAGHERRTLVAGLLARYPDLAAAARRGELDPLRPGVVHRLDKDTSGLLVVARSESARRSLAVQLADRTMGRTYRALAIGAILEDSGVVEAPVGRSTRDRTLMAVTVSGRPARTRYAVLQRYVRPVASTLLSVQLDTGRTHQIRVHLSAVGHPLLGDARYRGRRRELPLSRTFLHAERLRLVHPVSGEPIELVAPLPAELVEVLEQLS